MVKIFVVKKFGSEKSSVVKNSGSEKNGSEKFGGVKFGSQIHHTVLWSRVGEEATGKWVVSSWCDDLV